MPVSREGRLAQLVEHLVYTERVSGSSPLAPTRFFNGATAIIRANRDQNSFPVIRRQGTHPFLLRQCFGLAASTAPRDADSHVQNLGCAALRRRFGVVQG